MDRTVHRRRVPSHSAGDRPARPPEGGRQTGVRQALGSSTGRDSGHGIHDQILWLGSQAGS